MSYQFGNTLYDTHHRMLEAAAYEWWTGGGQNTPEVIDAIGCSDDGIPEAIEMIAEWQLAEPTQNAFTGEDGPSWVEANDVTLAQMAEALLDFWRTRPDRAIEEDAL